MPDVACHVLRSRKETRVGDDRRNSRGKAQIAFAEPVPLKILFVACSQAEHCKRRAAKSEGQDCAADKNAETHDGHC